MQIAQLVVVLNALGRVIAAVVIVVSVVLVTVIAAVVVFCSSISSIICICFYHVYGE